MNIIKRFLLWCEYIQHRYDAYHHENRWKIEGDLYDFWAMRDAVERGREVLRQMERLTLEIAK